MQPVLPNLLWPALLPGLPCSAIPFTLTRIFWAPVPIFPINPLTWLRLWVSMTVGSLVSEVFCVSYLQEGKKKSFNKYPFLWNSAWRKEGNWGIDINWFQFIQVRQGFGVLVKNGGKMRLIQQTVLGNFSALQFLWIIQQNFNSQNFVPHRVILVYMSPILNLKWLQTSAHGLGMELDDIKDLSQLILWFYNSHKESNISTLKSRLFEHCFHLSRI